MIFRDFDQLMPFDGPCDRFLIRQQTRADQLILAKQRPITREKGTRVFDLEKLDEYLSSERSPENSMSVSDLDGFITGTVCSPDLILPSEWMSKVWGTNSPAVEDVDDHAEATKAIIERYNEIAVMLNDEPSVIEPVFWQAPEGHTIAMDWCEGVMDAFHMRMDDWADLLETEDGRDWMFPILAHMIDDEGTPLVGATQDQLDALLVQVGL